MDNGPELVSAKLGMPYPPGFPIMVPGQVVTREILTVMCKLEVKEIHGCHAANRLELLKPAALTALKKWAGDLAFYLPVGASLAMLL